MNSQLVAGLEGVVQANDVGVSRVAQHSTLSLGVLHLVASNDVALVQNLHGIHIFCKNVRATCIRR